MGVFDGMADIFAETFGAEEGTATYTPPGSASVPCRPIVSDAVQPDSAEKAEFAGKPHVTGKIVSVRKSEVAAPVAGGVFTIGADSYCVVGEPQLELPERAMWRCMTA